MELDAIRERLAAERDPIHQFFGLSYSSYLVIPRTALQSAPVEWQRDFVALIEQLHQMFPEADGAYWVRRKDPVSNVFVEDPLADYQRGRRRLEPKRD